MSIRGLGNPLSQREHEAPTTGVRETSETVPSWDQIVGWLGEMDLLRRVQAA
jgi:hypothetical protein